MNPQPQTRLHPNGDCLRACIASILEIPVKRVPDFTGIDNPDEDVEVNGFKYPAYYVIMQTFLHSMNLTFIEVQINGRPWYPLPFDSMAMFIGTLKSGGKHAIVGRMLHNQFYPVFDPRCEEMDESPFPAGIEAIGLLVPTDPFIPRRMGRALERVCELTKGLVGEIPTNIRQEALEGLYGAGAATIDQVQDEAVFGGLVGPDGQALRKNGQ